MKHLLLPAAALVGVFAAVNPPTPLKAAVARRDLVSWGGYALRSGTCPSGTSACGTAHCCPNSYTCNGATYGATRICCPSSEQTFPLPSPWVSLGRTKLTR